MSSITRFFSSILHRLPDLTFRGFVLRTSKLGDIYDGHTRFFNDGMIELLGLIIANASVWWFTHLGIVETPLVIMNLLLVTPLTFALKHLGHKYWVWR